MLSADDRKRIIDAIALLEAVLRSTDDSVKSAALLRAIERAGQAAVTGAGGSGAGAGGADYGRENTGRWHRQL